ncbi:MAG: DNA polymerase III subunit delta, partial [Thermoguttaceae bacterium]|nr:DNA polymerase III subunit delta [Thermoguttaceae bacterium]
MQTKSFPKNTRFYKKIDAVGLGVDCDELKSREISRWLTQWAPKACGAKLTIEAAELLVELVGNSLGALDQETRRLALLVSPPESC